MREKTGKKANRLDPKRIVDGADRGFVKLAHSIMCLVTWRNPLAGTSPRTTASRPAGGETAANQRFFAALAKRIEQILNQAPRAGVEPDDGVLQLKLRDLFHRDAGRRLAAARWIRKRRAERALPTLESVEAIEESDQVRKEIARAVSEIKGSQTDETGGVRCTSF